MKYKLLIDLPKNHLKKGAIFEWDKEEQCYITKELAWFLTPLIEKSDIKNKKWFKKL